MFTVSDIIHLIQYYYQCSSYDAAAADVETFRLESLRGTSLLQEHRELRILTCIRCEADSPPCRLSASGSLPSCAVAKWSPSSMLDAFTLTSRLWKSASTCTSSCSVERSSACTSVSVMQRSALLTSMSVELTVLTVK